MQTFSSKHKAKKNIVFGSNQSRKYKTPAWWKEGGREGGGVEEPAAFVMGEKEESKRKDAFPTEHAYARHANGCCY